METQPEKENQLIKNSRSSRGVRMGVMPRVQSNLLRALHMNRKKKLLKDLLILHTTAIKRATVRFRGVQEMGAESFNNWEGGGDVTNLSPFWEGMGRK